MKKLKLMLDFGEGPIWTEYFDEVKDYKQELKK